ncbi:MULTISPECIES: hypothetical protein [unclassified Methylophaga]|jgi:type II secretory pathway component PulF|uniref:hypothetical protein n=1 Tax=unclassified Methylophaga TaxID=2629249 RepID=UPI0025F2CD3F|nr:MULTISPECIES: hypothetical protein [unclassified Methylophaga]|tara:strand:+ start:2076 stop:3230 length:1155 start_codon:yes stop_codon:yes gene_type:complete
MQFVVKFRHLDGSTRLTLMEAEHQVALLEQPGLEDAIEGSWEIPFGLKIGSNKLKPEEQLLLVAQVATLVDSGADITQGITEIAVSTPFLKKHMQDPRIEHASRISDYLELFGVDGNVVLLVRSGEESGRMSQAINMAVENIQQDIELRKATSADLRLGLTYLILGISSILLLSLILGGPAQQIIDVPQLKANNATRLIVKLRAIQTDHTLLFLLVVGGTMAGIRYLLNNVSEFRGLWGVRQLDDLLKARRSANFLAAWMPLFASGFSPDKSLNLIAKNNSGTNKLAVESIMDGVEQGATIPQSLLAQYWSPSFIIGMKAFDAAHDEARHKLLVRIKGMLITEIFVTGKRFSKLALHIGMISAVFTVFLIAAGFYAPMLLSRGG